MSTAAQESIIKDAEVEATLAGAPATPERSQVADILARARELHGLSSDEVATLMNVETPELLEEVFHTAREVKEGIYGNRLVLFAPLYFSNLCNNECLYCAFRHSNRELERRVLTQEQIAQETKALVEQGHKRVLILCGESYPGRGFEYVLDTIDTVYSVKSGPGEIRRVNVNVAPLTPEEFRELKAHNIGTYQLFQETYHHEIYSQVHRGGKKVDFEWRVTAMDRAMDAGIDDVGLGVLLGLAPWKYEVLGMLQHVAHLESAFGVGPHTISVPRIEPALGSEMASHPPHQLSDQDFLKAVAILRLAVPYTGIIMSTRETPELRRQTFTLGVSQISGGSRVNPGGYAEGDPDAEAQQFCMGDHRTLDEVIRDITQMGFIPSFCTACYRLGRTGEHFMELAKPGDIKWRCTPNALATFEEYLLDYASPETRQVGDQRIGVMLAELDEKERGVASKMIEQVKAGNRDVYC
ncbi:MAG TPA: [FeFe] hydrogenase H-cluster radical SAM maturase HydG [Armatimonadota bacterium]|jgi:2-iminoacetate synthase